MKTPLIGITASKNNEPDDRLPQAYSTSVIAAGGAPVLLPTGYPVEAVPELLGRLDGLLLSGGGDVSPALFPAKDPHLCDDILPDRDMLEFALLKTASQMNLPVLGICRGMQVINVSRGGTLYTDIPSQFTTSLQHSTPEENGRDSLVHEVTIESDSQLARILGVPRLKVNSFHHQAALVIGQNLQVVAHASDGLVEAVEDRSMRFFVGVQWHPECLQAVASAHRALFTAFIEAAQS